MSTHATRCARHMLAVCLIATGCSDRNAYQAPPPVEVVVAHPLHGAMEDTLETDGLVAGTQTVEIRAQVEGRVTGIHFQDGQIVQEGTLLFTIDPRTYRAAATGASADVANLQAQLAFARADFQRTQQLYEADNVSRQQYEQARQRMRALEAQVGAARAAAAGAAVQLDYTRVTAPITGRLSRRFVDRGQLVGAGEPTLLATIVSAQDTYVEFSLSQTELLYARQRLQERGVSAESLREHPIEVRVALPGETGFPHVGHLQSAENTLAASTGTLQMRGIFPNPDGALIPGLFCRVEIPLGESEGLAVPEVAIALDQVGRYVFVVDDEGVVLRRNITLGNRKGELRRITEGLTAEDRVIVRGMARVRVGSHVEATEETLQASGPEAGESPDQAEAAADQGAADEAAATDEAAE